MSAQEVIDELKRMQTPERAKVAKFLVEQDDSWIPQSFKNAIADAKAGRFAEEEDLFNDAPPPSAR